jgi:hypothetical protein
VKQRRVRWRSRYNKLERIVLPNHRRLLEPIGNIPPAKAEKRYHAVLDDVPVAA